MARVLASVVASGQASLRTGDSLVQPIASVAGVDDALQRATGHLLSIQSPEGYWWGELEANVTVPAEYLMLEHFLGIGDAARWEKISRYILQKQNADGSWSLTEK